MPNPECRLSAMKVRSRWSAQGDGPARSPPAGAGRRHAHAPAGGRTGAWATAGRPAPRVPPATPAGGGGGKEEVRSRWSTSSAGSTRSPPAGAGRRHARATAGGRARGRGGAAAGRSPALRSSWSEAQRRSERRKRRSEKRRGRVHTAARPLVVVVDSMLLPALGAPRARPPRGRDKQRGERRMITQLNRLRTHANTPKAQGALHPDHACRRRRRRRGAGLGGLERNSASSQLRKTSLSCTFTYGSSVSLLGPKPTQRMRKSRSPVELKE